MRSSSANLHHHGESVDSLDDTSKLHYEQQGSRWFVAYFKLLERFGRIVFGFWIAVFLLSLFYGPKFLTMGDDSVKPPKNTPSWYAQKEFEVRFAEQAKEVPLLVLVRSLAKGVDIASPELFTFAKQLKANVIEYNSTVGDGNVLSVISYYDVSGTLLDGAKQEFVSPDKAATFINIMVKGDRITHERYEFVKFLKKELAQLNPDPMLFQIGVTGFDAMAYDSSDDQAKNIAKIDVFTVPIAMCLLGLMIRSWRLLLFSFFNLGCAILSSFAFMAFMVELGIAPHPESATAQLMEVITMAVSIDWSLFLHRRYRDELKVGATPREAAFLSLMHSGHVVVMSGMTLIVVFIGFIALPAATVQMDGACCAIGTTIAMMIALTNTPAIWLMFPEFCSDFDPRCCKRRTVEDIEREAMRLGISDVVSADSMMNGRSSTTASAPLIASEEFDDASVPVVHRHIHPMYSGPRFRFTKWVTRFPNNIFSIILVYILVVPLALQVRDININQNILVSMPRHSEAANTFRHAFENFPGGTFAPFYILVTTQDRSDKEKVLSNQFFEAAKYASVETLNACKTHDKRFTDQSVTGPVLLDGVPISHSEAKVFLNTAKSLPCNPLFGRDVAPWWKGACSVAKEYEFEWTQAVNADENAMLITLTVPFFPFAQDSQSFIDLVYRVLDGAKAQYPQFDFYLCGVEVGFDALQRRVENLFPALLAVTFTIVFTILGFLLRSAFVPIRLALTLVAPLCAVFGSAVLVYQKGALEWTGIEAFGKMDGFFCPILLLSMIIGLSLDWDVLLVSRIMEHREAGYDIQASICKAVCETGGTISTAGIIMCLAFGGMLFSDQLIINACGFILTIALLLDTFLVNTVLVPALISIGDKVAWWPVQMPMNDLKTLENCDEFPAHE